MGSLPVPYVPVNIQHSVVRGALDVHRYTYAPPRCKISQYRMIFISLSVFLWDVLLFDGVGLEGLKSNVNVF